MIPYEDFGGVGPILHFAHPNAYPPGSFRQFLQPLTAEHHVLAMAQRPLWAAGPPDEAQDWALLAGDLIDFLRTHELRDIIGVGHSLGGVVTMKAAVQEPGLFRALVLIEPVFLPPSLASSFDNNVDWVAHEPMAAVARKRRRNWPSRQTAFEHFRAKSVFSPWSDAALWEYLDAGLAGAPDGQVSLRYDPEWEAWVYSRMPLDIWRDVAHITQPTLAIRAAKSDTLSEEAWATWQTLQPGARFVELPDMGHMAPMEQPERVAEQVKVFLRDLAGS